MPSRITGIIEPDTPITDREGMELAEELYDELVRQSIVKSFREKGSFIIRTTAQHVLHDNILGVHPINHIKRMEEKA